MMSVNRCVDQDTESGVAGGNVGAVNIIAGQAA